MVRIKETSATFVVADLLHHKVFEETRSFVGTHDEKSLRKLYLKSSNYGGYIKIVKVKDIEIIF